MSRPSGLTCRQPDLIIGTLEHFPAKWSPDSRKKMLSSISSASSDCKTGAHFFADGARNENASP
jgi:hypothetical protein